MEKNKKTKRVSIDIELYKQLSILATLEDIEVHELINNKLTEELKHGNSLKIRNLVESHKNSKNK